MATSLNFLKKTAHRKQVSKTPREVGVVLDPDGQMLKQAMAAEGNTIESLDLPISDIESRKTIVDELNAESENARNNSDNSPQTPSESTVPDDASSTTEPSTPEKSEVLKTTEASNSERVSQPKTEEEDII